MRELDARHAREEFASDMVHASDARGAEVDLAGILPDILDKLRNVLRWKRGMNDQRARCSADSSNRSKILAWIVPRIVVHARRDRESPGEPKHERIAVW